MRRTRVSSQFQATWRMPGAGGARRRRRAAAAAASSTGQDSTSAAAHMLVTVRPRRCRRHTCARRMHQLISRPASSFALLREALRFSAMCGPLLSQSLCPALPSPLRMRTAASSYTI